MWAAAFCWNRQPVTWRRRVTLRGPPFLAEGATHLLLAGRGETDRGVGGTVACEVEVMSGQLSADAR